jgi:glycosyltransferase involved in cell wall biosynthesis
VAFPVESGQSLKHNALGHVNRLMARILARSADRIFVSTTGWQDLLRDIDPRTPDVTWLPIPSNVATESCNPAAVRARFANAGAQSLIGHFGTYGHFLSAVLDQVLPACLAGDPGRHLLLLGRHSTAYGRRLVRQNPALSARVHAVGELASQEVADHLAACDLLVAPYSDGVTCRRSSIMAGLALGKAVVTNAGPYTEPLWTTSGAVCLLPAPEPSAFASAINMLMQCAAERIELGARARNLYFEQFSIERTIETLRSIDRG